MTDPLRSRARGEKVLGKDLARDNAILAAARATAEAGPRTGGTFDPAVQAQGLIAPFQNAVVKTDADGNPAEEIDLLPGNAMGISSMLSTEDEDALKAFRSGIMLMGVIPDIDVHVLGGWGICMDYVPFGDTGRVLLYGLIQVELQWYMPPSDVGLDPAQIVPYHGHVYADILDNDVQIESAASGPCRILFSDPQDEHEQTTWVLMSKGW